MSNRVVGLQRRRRIAVMLRTNKHWRHANCFQIALLHFFLLELFSGQPILLKTAFTASDL